MNAAADGFVSSHYWRALYYFNLYRLTLGAGLVTLGASRGFVRVGEQAPGLFMVSAVLFALSSALYIVTITRGRPPFRTQAHIQFTTDVVLITLMVHASGGINSGLYLLLLVFVAAAGVVLSGRLTLYVAALATIATFVEHTLNRAAYAGAGPYTPVALLGIGLFSVGLAVYFVSWRIRQTEQLAEQRGVELAQLSRLNELVVRQLDAGVLVIETDGRVIPLNNMACLQLHLPTGGGVIAPDTLPAALVGALRTPANSNLAPVIEVHGRRLRPRSYPLAVAGGPLVVLLEDVSRQENEAQRVKLAALGRLVSALAHELRNPLGAISHAAQLLGESSVLPVEDRRLLGIVETHVGRIARLTDTILKLGRREAASAPRLALDDWLSGFRDGFLAARPDAADAITIQPTHLNVCADPDRLNQALTNLCDNALQHGRATIIRISGGRAESGIAFLDVADDGAGVPEGLRERLFEPFFTTDASGTGLGLYISRELCESAGGRLEYIPEAKGARFRIWFAADPYCA